MAKNELMGNTSIKYLSRKHKYRRYFDFLINSCLLQNTDEFLIKTKESSNELDWGSVSRQAF